MIEKEDDTKDLRFYSQKSIATATFIGGPLAAGYLIRENYLSLNKPDEGKKSLLIGFVATVLLFTGIFMIPEAIIEKVPSYVIPAIYTAIIYLIVEKIHGKILNKHKENENNFYSGWRAAGVGFVSLIVLLIGIFGYAYLSVGGDEFEKYDAEIAKFSKNETESLIFFEHYDTETDNSLLQELENSTIPKWEENIEIIKNSNTIENLPSELLEQNKILLKYSELRLKAFELYKKAIKEDTTIYEQQLEQIHLKINEQIEKLNS
ncbi:hypothetical protein [Cellulophaga fucicola]|uniref:Uncharacterized protein n=1 Tax=Cellulophaga fucicola TaxID=76595 RepID=A0A1K1PJK0_9FLAO|nr:hypothetical protein [Cellulophaga fucicola]SFW47796.1 hypothetical protein SAMN05660313_01934 [Cellulophaga fucicola]